MLAGWPAMGAEVDISRLPPAATNRIDFDRDIKPILEANCLRCHGPEKPKSRFRLDNRAAALKGGEEGVDILPATAPKVPLSITSRSSWKLPKCRRLEKETH